MISKLDKKEIIILFPHLRENTTSFARFYTVVDVLLEQGFTIKIIEFTFPITKSLGMGHDVASETLNSKIKNHILSVEPKLNLLQKAAFDSIKNGNIKLSKIFNYFHQLIFKRDIFYPGNKTLTQINVCTNNGGCILSFGGPFSWFAFADKLADKLNYDLILDYRDPWTFGYTSLSSYTIIQNIKNNLQRKKEMQLLRKASLITTVSETLKSYYPKEFQEKLFVISNGSNYEEKEIFIEIQPETFDVVYLGTIYHEQLEDESFFKAFQSFIQHKDQSKINLNFLGSHLNPALKNVLHKYGLHHITTITKRLSKTEVLPYLNKASIFLHLKYGERSGIITSKQADYLAFRKPILLPITDHGDLEKSITQNNAGFVGNSMDDILGFLENRWSTFIKNDVITLHSTVDLKDLSREAQAKKFVDLITIHQATRHLKHNERSAH
jgi:glycosyltransferase involved in cell wall biosynthesis